MSFPMTELKAIINTLPNLKAHTIYEHRDMFIKALSKKLKDELIQFDEQAKVLTEEVIQYSYYKESNKDLEEKLLHWMTTSTNDPIVVELKHFVSVMAEKTLPLLDNVTNITEIDLINHTYFVSVNVLDQLNSEYMEELLKKFCETFKGKDYTQQEFEFVKDTYAFIAVGNLYSVFLELSDNLLDNYVNQAMKRNHEGKLEFTKDYLDTVEKYVNDNYGTKEDKELADKEEKQINEELKELYELIDTLKKVFEEANKTKEGN